VPDLGHFPASIPGQLQLSTGKGLTAVIQAAELLSLNNFGHLKGKTRRGASCNDLMWNQHSLKEFFITMLVPQPNTLREGSILLICLTIGLEPTLTYP
jgi:hypothetical protein